jgi:hypothetical protein
MAEYRRSRVFHPLRADPATKLFLAHDASPVRVQFATVDRGAVLKLVPGPDLVEQMEGAYLSASWILGDNKSDENDQDLSSANRRASCCSMDSIFSATRAGLSSELRDI